MSILEVWSLSISQVHHRDQKLSSFSLPQEVGGEVC